MSLLLAISELPLVAVVAEAELSAETVLLTLRVNLSVVVADLLKFQILVELYLVVSHERLQVERAKTVPSSSALGVLLEEPGRALIEDGLKLLHLFGGATVE